MVPFRYINLMDRRNIVGNRIRQARKSAKPPITQMDLVARLQVQGIRIDRSALSKIEIGRRPVTDIEAVAFAKALKVSVAWLLEETNDSVETPTKVIAVWGFALCFHTLHLSV
jgi:transcriptional regulator with XRE-family HTH domain